MTVQKKIINKKSGNINEENENNQNCTKICKHQKLSSRSSGFVLFSFVLFSASGLITGFSSMINSLDSGGLLGFYLQLRRRLKVGFVFRDCLFGS